VADPATNNLQQAMAHMDSVLFNIYSFASCEFVKADPYTDLFTDPTGDDPRLSAVGKLCLLAVANVPVNTSIGSIFMDYDITFYVPQLEDLNENDDSILRSLEIGKSLSDVPLGSRVAVSMNTGSSTPVDLKGGNIITGIAYPLISGLQLNGKTLPMNQIFEYAAKVQLPSGDGDFGGSLSMFDTIALATSSQAEESGFNSSRLVNQTGAPITNGTDILRFVKTNWGPCCKGSS
jgi:hypothetical protein